MDIEIEKGIPVADSHWIAKNGNRLDVYPLDQMDIGDSFKVAVSEGQTTKRLQILLCNASRRHVLKTRKGYKFTTRIISETEVRIWRIK